MPDEEERVVQVEEESRTLYVVADLTASGSPYPRTLMVDAEDRTYVVDFVEG